MGKSHTVRCSCQPAKGYQPRLCRVRDPLSLSRTNCHTTCRLCSTTSTRTEPRVTTEMVMIAWYAAAGLSPRPVSKYSPLSLHPVERVDPGRCPRLSHPTPRPLLPRSSQPSLARTVRPDRLFRLATAAALPFLETVRSSRHGPRPPPRRLVRGRVSDQSRVQLEQCCWSASRGEGQPPTRETGAQEMECHDQTTRGAATGTPPAQFTTRQKPQSLSSR